MGLSPSEGIYSAVFDPATGAFVSGPTLAAEVGCCPGWLCWHPTLPVMYTTNETMDDVTPSWVSSYQLTARGGLA